MRELKIKTEVLIAGGGTSGVCAAIQAARMGVKVVLVEVTSWLGGMLTAAGVSAIDGNHRLPSGLWGEFRNHLYEYYGGPQAVKTGWVSHTLFEPHVGERIFQKMVKYESNITVLYGFWIINVLKKDNRIMGAIFKNEYDVLLIVEAQVSIDATEYGDLMAYAGCDYCLGRESSSETGEPYAPEKQDDIIQDITYVAILKDYGKDADKTLPRPAGYDPTQYQGMCKEVAENPDSDVVDCQTMLNYGRLPNNKFMMNWPSHGNDFYLNLIEMSHEERLEELKAAKNFTLGLIHYIQTKLGKKTLGLADDEFPTSDRLALIPYIRESRRVRGMVKLSTMDIENPHHQSNTGLYKMGVAVGDYPLDHHHKKAPKPIEEAYPQIHAFNIPYACLVPIEIDGLLIAEKSISVTHLVNGSTRRQPVVMQIGQAAGASAALCVKKQIQPRQVNIRELQQVLLDANCWLMPFQDISPNDWAFQAVQRVGLCGAMRGELISKDWANEMHFQPTDPVSYLDTTEAISIATGNNLRLAKSRFSQQDDSLSYAEAIYMIWQAIGKPNPRQSAPYFEDVLYNDHSFKAVQYFEEQGWLRKLIGQGKFSFHDKISRVEFAVLIDYALNPFAKEIK